MHSGCRVGLEWVRSECRVVAEKVQSGYREGAEWETRYWETRYYSAGGFTDTTCL